jgi:hypothetical protein
VLVGAGGFLALSAKRDYDAVASDCPARGCSSTAYDVRQSARARADVATVVMGVGGLAVAGGIVLIVARPRGSAPPRTGVALALGPGGVTVRVPLR